MPRGYRYVIVAAVGWLALCGAKPAAEQPNAPGNSKAFPAAQPSPTPQPTPAPSSTGKFTAYPGYNPDPCYHAKDHDAADLCAQWRASIAAEKAAGAAKAGLLWSAIATVLSLLTVIGLIITIWQTNGALGEARRGNRLNLMFEKRARRKDRESAAETKAALAAARQSARASEKLAKVAQENGRRELRAYLDFDLIELITREFPNDDTQIYVGVCVKLVNFGKTPAENIDIKVIYSKFSGEVETSMVNVDKPELGGITPGDHMQWKDFIQVSKDSYEQMRNMVWRLQVAIEVTFKDAFDEERILSAVYQSGRGDDPLGFLSGSRIST